MKTRVDIVTGFLNAGKTTYINASLQNKSLENDKIVIIQFEAGESSISEGLLNQNIILVNALTEETDLNDLYIESIMNQYNPNKIIIEFNGMHALEKVFSIFEKPNLRKKCFLGKIICIVDTSTFAVYERNMGGILQNQIIVADRILLNKIEDENDKMIETEKKIRELNKKGELCYEVANSKKSEIDFQGATIYESRSYIKMSHVVSSLFFVCALWYLLFSVLRGLSSSAVKLDFSKFEAFQMVFISILLQTFPFMLVGVFISSIIQVFLSKETMIKFFPKKYGLGFVTALFGGLLLPVCECAIVPMTAGLVKKGVALPVAVTFMLAAPIVNPIVIISTLYAFPGHPEITVYRVYFGLVIALVVGIILTIFPESKPVLLDQAHLSTCDCVYCNTEFVQEERFWRKLQMMFLHAGDEFFSAGKFLVLGAILTSMIQTVVSKDIFLHLWGKEGLALGVMMATAFFFSVCSTSDAFIARNFWNSFSTSSIMGFLVFGPMMDIKNLFMLFSGFRKSFVIKLTLLITGVSFVLLYFMTSLLI
ncbi:permease [Anaerotignum sp.]|uniref:permease n=1 Tax=Anaerotignum sp. TaxID=2039241 RepID=UPI00289F407A|nr:permease [Anaerotignum sp.]